MKYRHSFHAGNFADVHKHVALLALIDALERKDKGFLYLDTHAGRGSYDLSTPTGEAASGIGRLTAAAPRAPELQRYLQRLAAFRARRGQRHLYPGSALWAAQALRAQDRALFIEREGGEAHALEAALAALCAGGAPCPALRVERGDGFERLRASLPPRERRGLILIDPPYEETRADFTQLAAALADGLRRFPTGVFLAWYPIKEARATAAWLAQCAASLEASVLVSELWLYPPDSRVALNGSGLLIANPPWQLREGMQLWLPELKTLLAAHNAAGSAVRMLSESRA